jgi:hypothetical protein
MQYVVIFCVVMCMIYFYTHPCTQSDIYNPQICVKFWFHYSMKLMYKKKIIIKIIMLLLVLVFVLIVIAVVVIVVAIAVIVQSISNVILKSK